ncbi:hypothetical protein [Streptomyces sp. NBC_01373]|uniref:hypothetical protein n=1 Tax=unclassified Streptomyces TaxID=2593676 RepID=UPI0022546057|nr:hypothetical protein [Streptomyces sp. NBC_01373]MCX4706711.1 nucleoside 2-deoxyribosyltransferase domain-containing protein [Streptomyces sp. NBC_01373]
MAWDHHALAGADVVLLWFCQESMQPMVLYELGAHAVSGATLVVGAHPGYERRLDVVAQHRHARPDRTVHDALQATAGLPPPRSRPWWPGSPVRRG